MMYFVVCDDKIYDIYFEKDFYVVKLEDVL